VVPSAPGPAHNLATALQVTHRGCRVTQVTHPDGTLSARRPVNIQQMLWMRYGIGKCSWRAALTWWSVSPCVQQSVCCLTAVVTAVAAEAAGLDGRLTGTLNAPRLIKSVVYSVVCVCTLMVVVLKFDQSGGVLRCCPRGAMHLAHSRCLENQRRQFQIPNAGLPTMCATPANGDQ
jgi:hypothetical protein